MNVLRSLTMVLVIGYVSVVHAQQDSTLDLLLNKWTEATRECRSIDFTFARLTYDTTFGDPHANYLVSACDGRFYCESTGHARYDVSTDDVLIWHPDAKIWFNPASRKYDRIEMTEEQVREELRRLFAERNAWFGRWRLDWARLMLAQPDDVLPFLLLTDAEDFRQRFDLSHDGFDEELLLTAEAKDPGAEGFEMEQFIFDRPESTEPHLPKAIKVVHSRARAVVHAFQDVRVNLVPADREQLLFPDRRLVRDVPR